MLLESEVICSFGSAILIKNTSDTLTTVQMIQTQKKIDSSNIFFLLERSIVIN